MLFAAAIVATLAALVAIYQWRHNHVNTGELSKLAARIDEQTAAQNGRPHLPHVEVAPINPPTTPPAG
jgi:hypothetical protein